MNKATGAKPNILLITADQLRQDFVGAYKLNDFIKTPNLDALAENGCLYNNAYSPNPVCIPARHNLITGLTAKHHGFDDNYFGPEAKPCPHDLTTFAEIASDAGYMTMAIGKMHFQPERRATGFDHFLNCDEVVRDVMEDEYAQFVLENGYDDVGSFHGVRNVLYMQPQQSTLPTEMHGSHWIADKSIEFIKSRGDKERPFLLWTGFIQPHPPFNIPKDWAHMYDGKIPAPYVSKTPLSLLAEENKCIANLPNDESVNRMRELYACAVSFVDYNVGRIVEALREIGELDNTLIIFTSDHGEMLGDLETYQKFLPHDPSAKIPMIAHWPNHIEKGTVRDEFVDLNDFLPTVSDVAGEPYKASYKLPGESLFATEPKKDRTLQYVEHQRESKRWCSIRDKRYKYVHFYGDADQLFDMENDPQEQNNLLHNCTDESILKIRSEMRSILLKYEEEYGLEGYVKDGDFIAMPRYTISNYRECCYPASQNRRSYDEPKKHLKTEILEAIADEPLVNLQDLDIIDELVISSEFTKEEALKFVEENSK